MTSYPNQPELREREDAFLKHSKWWHGMQLQFNHVRSVKPARELILPHMVAYYDAIIGEYPVFTDDDDDTCMDIGGSNNNNGNVSSTLSNAHQRFFSNIRHHLDMREVYYLACFLQHDPLTDAVLQFLATETLPQIMNQSSDANKNFVHLCRYLSIPFETSEKDFSNLTNELDGILDKNEFNFQKIQQHFCTLSSTAS